jgi:hypothetical protein
MPELREQLRVILLKLESSYDHGNIDDLGIIGADECIDELIDLFRSKGIV